MHFFRTLSRVALGCFVSLLVFLVPIVFAIHAIVGTPTPIKRALSESGVYDTVVRDVINDAIAEKADDQTKQLLNEPVIRDTINKALSPQFLQTAAESNLDSAYAWLQGKTETIQIHIDADSARVQLIQGLTTYVKTKAEKLPACTRTQLSHMSPDQDILSAPCLPPGVTPQKAADEFGAQATKQFEPLKNISQTVQPNKQATTARDAFKLFNTYFWIVLVLAAIASAAYILFHHSRRLGLRRYARILMINGITLGLLLGILTILLNRAFDLLRDSSPENIAQAKVVDVIIPLANTLKLNLLLWLVGYIIAAATIFYVLRRTSRLKASDVTKSSGV